MKVHNMNHSRGQFQPSSSFSCPRHFEPIKGICLFRGNCSERLLCRTCRKCHDNNHLNHYEELEDLINGSIANDLLGDFEEMVKKIDSKNLIASQNMQLIIGQIDSLFNKVEGHIVQKLRQSKTQIFEDISKKFRSNNTVKQKIMSGMENIDKAFKAASNGGLQAIYVLENLVHVLTQALAIKDVTVDDPEVNSQQSAELTQEYFTITNSNNLFQSAKNSLDKICQEITDTFLTTGATDPSSKLSANIQQEGRRTPLRFGQLGEPLQDQKLNPLQNNKEPMNLEDNQSNYFQSTNTSSVPRLSQVQTSLLNDIQSDIVNTNASQHDRQNYFNGANIPTKSPPRQQFGCDYGKQFRSPGKMFTNDFNRLIQNQNIINQTPSFEMQEDMMNPTRQNSNLNFSTENHDQSSMTTSIQLQIRPGQTVNIQQSQEEPSSPLQLNIRNSIPSPDLSQNQSNLQPIQNNFGINSNYSNNLSRASPNRQITEMQLQQTITSSKMPDTATNVFFGDKLTQTILELQNRANQMINEEQQAAEKSMQIIQHNLNQTKLSERQSVGKSEILMQNKTVNQYNNDREITKEDRQNNIMQLENETKHHGSLSQKHTPRNVLDIFEQVAMEKKSSSTGRITEGVDPGNPLNQPLMSFAQTNLNNLKLFDTNPSTTGRQHQQQHQRQLKNTETVQRQPYQKGTRSINLSENFRKNSDLIECQGNINMEHTQILFGGMTYISPKSQLVIGDLDGKIQVWDTTKKHCVTKFQAHDSEIFRLLYVEEKDILVTGGADNIVNVWDCRRRFKLSNTYKGHSMPVYALEYLSGLNMMATGGEDCKLHLWDIENSTQVSVLPTQNIKIGCLCYLKKSEKIAIGFDKGQINLVQVRSNKVVWVHQAHSNFILNLVSIEEQNLLFSGSDDGFVKMWKITGNRGEFLKEFGHEGNMVRSFMVLYDKDLLLSNHDGQFLRVWKISDGEETKKFKDDTFGESIVSLGNRGKIATGNQSQVKIWNLNV